MDLPKNSDTYGYLATPPFGEPHGRESARKSFPPCPFSPIHPSFLARDDSFFMKLAYNQALKAWNCGEVPIGAVIEYGGEVVAQAHNTVESSRDPTAHAEILAITQAAAKCDDWRLSGATLYVQRAVPDVCGRVRYEPSFQGSLRGLRPENGLFGRGDEVPRFADAQPLSDSRKRRVGG